MLGYTLINEEGHAPLFTAITDVHAGGATGES